MNQNLISGDKKDRTWSWAHLRQESAVYSRLQTPAELRTVFTWWCPDWIPDGFTRYTDYTFVMFVLFLVRLIRDSALIYPTSRPSKSLPTTFLFHSTLYYTEWAKSRYTVIYILYTVYSNLYTIYCIPTFWPTLYITTFCEIHFNYFFNIPTNVHNIYTLKALKFTLKTLKNLPLHVSVSFLKPSSGGS